MAPGFFFFGKIHGHRSYKAWDRIAGFLRGNAHAVQRLFRAKFPPPARRTCSTSGSANQHPTFSRNVKITGRIAGRCPVCFASMRMPRSPVTGRPRPSAARRPNLLIEQDVICVEFKCECECECSPRSRCASRTAEGLEEGAQTSSHPGRIGWVCRSSARTAGGMMTCWKSSGSR